MSRIISHQQNVFKKKVILAVVALFAVVIFIMTVGFKLLLNTSLMVSQKFGAKQTDLTPASQSFYGQLSIDSIPESTNSAHIVLMGTARNYDTVIIYLNEENVRAVDTQKDTFQAEIGELIKGNNSVYVVAKSAKYKKTATSNTYTVVYKNDKPKLEISEPTDNLRTNKPEISVKGKTENGNTVKVNGYPVVIEANAGFQTAIKLNEGDNKIIITVEDEFGNTDSKTLTVNYQKDN